MKKFLSLILTLTIFLTLTACGSKGGGTEVTIFAAASMTESLTAIAEAYRAKAPDVTLIFNFDSSGTLKTQIEEGAECDIFISAAQKQMDELSKIDPESRIDLLGNQVVLITAEGSGTTVSNFANLALGNYSLLALGNSDVPVGQYALEILDNLSISLPDLERRGKITYGSNVKEVLAQVASGAAELGIVYATDAAGEAGIVVLDEAQALCSPVLYPSAILKGRNSRAVRDFYLYLQSPEAMEIFAEFGFFTPEG